MLAEPGRDPPSESGWTAKRDAPVCERVGEAGITHPHFRQGAEVGFDRDVDLPSRVGEAEVDVVGVDHEPIEAPLERKRGKHELEGGRGYAQAAWRKVAADVPQQQARVELVRSVVGTNPTLPPLTEGEDDRQQLPTGLRQPVGAGVSIDDPGALEIPESLGQECR